MEQVTGSFFTQTEDHLTTEAVRSSTEHDLPHTGLAKQRIEADRCTPVIFQERRGAVDARIGLLRKRSTTSFQASHAYPSQAEYQDILLGVATRKTLRRVILVATLSSPRSSDSCRSERSRSSRRL